ncbi:hypothetical protein M7I_2859 [Glarea lozoyensis 74030]|uniref:Uncharacterized protein n=1 Tax=Glarea lozoyensis (strain ATCC 74030 / MF5533) TaxID=1104152 RepID=H0EJX5_GLAL7|nr:hypothetical protein M7I_2859 [Glarea lozoyensis 74030]
MEATSSSPMVSQLGLTINNDSGVDLSASVPPQRVNVIEPGQIPTPTKDPRKVRLNARLRAATKKSIDMLFNEAKKHGKTLGDHPDIVSSSPAKKIKSSTSNTGEHHSEINDQAQEPEDLTLVTSQQREQLSTKDMEIALLRAHLDHMATVQTILKETLTTQQATIEELRTQNKSHATERRTLQHENTQLLNAGTSRAKFDLMKNQVENLTSSLTEMTMKVEEYEKEKEILRNTGYTTFTAYCTALNTERKNIQPLVDIGRSVRSRLLEL